MKIALVGNQNSGKTTLFNLLTGMNAKVGNWPGVTIEKKEGTIRGTKNKIIDLPGIYSLSPYSKEEEIARKYIFEEMPDVIINIVDATNIERSLYLTTQLMELDTNIIVALNMADILDSRGIKIDIEKLQKELGVKIVLISALKEIGIDRLIKEIDNDNKKIIKRIYDKNIEELISLIDVDSVHKRFVRVKLIEEDKRFKKYKKELYDKRILKCSKKYDTDLEEVVATERYEFIEKVLDKCLTLKKQNNNISEKLDKIFLNKYLAFPIFAIIMFLVYFLSVGVVGRSSSEMIASLVDTFSSFVSGFLKDIGTSEVLNSLIVDGIIAGVGSVLGFLLQLIILFICISLLEVTGYMSRIAFLLDKIFRRVGLSGKSLIPFIVGSGCSVPGIMGSRIIENDDEREMTAILTPFIPCSAKLPIIAMFSTYFFKDYSGIVAASFYFLAIFIIIISALILSKFVFVDTSDLYISELPLYKLPSFKYVFKDVFDKVVAFIERAGSIILFCSIVVWFLLSFSPSLSYGVDVENSILACIGKSISWIFYPVLGEDNWALTVSIIQGLVAKEQVISSMSVISGFTNSSGMFSSGSIFSSITPAAAYAFVAFNLFSAPCFGALGALRRELGSTKKVLKVVLFQTIIAWIIAFICYQVGIRIEKSIISISDIVICIIIFSILCFIGIKYFKNKDNKCNSCPFGKTCKQLKK